MAMSTSIPLSEYLKTSYRPHCDYVDGEVKGRNVPGTPIRLVLADSLRSWTKLGSGGFMLRTNGPLMR
jgi:hypothetical protein